MTAIIQRRHFLSRLGLLIGGFAIFGSEKIMALPKIAVAKFNLYSLSGVKYPGFLRRLKRLQVSNIDDAFNLATRHSEIQITRI